MRGAERSSALREHPLHEILRGAQHLVEPVAALSQDVKRPAKTESLVAIAKPRDNALWVEQLPEYRDDRTKLIDPLGTVPLRQSAGEPPPHRPGFLVGQARNVAFANAYLDLKGAKNRGERLVLG